MDVPAVSRFGSHTREKADKEGRRLGIAPFAVAMAVLIHIKRQRLAPMEGWVGKGVTWLDADYERLQSESRGVQE